MALGDISKRAEFVEQFINDLAESFREKRWVKILSLGGVVFAFLLYPTLVERGLELLGSKKPEWYSYLIWGMLTASFFVAAFLVALLTKKRQEPETTTTATSIIKGLLPYTNTKEDAEWFAKLQRGTILHDSIRFCAGEDFRLAILSGESGVGKTSFLQAGLLPNLNEKGYRPIYVKFTAASPLDSIRHALNGRAAALTADDNQSLLELLREATQSDTRLMVLILDQFEQFFAHNKSKTSRRPFIQQMAEWQKHGGALPVKILISIRGDFASRLIEFQNEMRYTLTPHNNLSLEKFDPQEAAHVIGVIAKESKIKMDEDFIKELTKHELSDRHDGTVSPVDIQILSWMIDGQKSVEERAFNQKAFQKLGGVEGLLERFLGRALNARETNDRRQSAIKVMLALTDQNIRAGALSLKHLKERLNGVIPDGDIEEAVSWLARGDVRLITPIHEQNVTLYELAHERIIQPLRRLAFKEITDVEKAQQLLDRRVNEWIGNNRSRRYLLTFTEWRLIKRYWTLFTLGSQKSQKEDYVSRSKRRFVAIGLGVAALSLIGFGGYSSYRIYQHSNHLQIIQIRERVLKDLEASGTGFSLDDQVALWLTAISGDTIDEALLKRLDNTHPFDILRRERRISDIISKVEKKDDLSRNLRRVEDYAKKLPRRESEGILIMIAYIFNKIGQPEDAHRVLSLFQEGGRDFHLDSYVFIFVAETYSDLKMWGEALSNLNMILGKSYERTSVSERLNMFPLMAKIYGKLENIDSALKGLAQIEQEIKNLRSFDKTRTQISVMDAYLNLGQREKAKSISSYMQEEATRFYNNVDEILLLIAIADTYSKYEMREEPFRILDVAMKKCAELDPTESEKDELYLSMAEVFCKLKLPDKAIEAIRQSFTINWEFQIQQEVISFTAEIYHTIGDTEESLREIETALADAQISKNSKLLSFLIEVYGNLGKAEKIKNLLAREEDHDYLLLLSSAFKAYMKLGKTDEAVDALRQMEIKIMVFSDERDFSMQSFIADGYYKLGHNQAALTVVERIKQAAQKNRSFNKEVRRCELAAIVSAKLNHWKIAQEIAQSENNVIDQIKTFQRLFLLSRGTLDLLNPPTKKNPREIDRY